MKKMITTAVILFVSFLSYSQTQIKVRVISAEDKTPVANASVTNLDVNNTVTTDSSGRVSFSVDKNSLNIQVSHVGYISKKTTLDLSLNSITEFIVEIERSEEEEEEIIIQSTRSSRTIRDIPTRVEFIAGEELDEKANMKPGDIRMVLTESTGIQTQQTSGTSANSSIRIQGLDGRYTQILKDGFPSYAGFSGGLGLLQTPPLDLKQIEVIKGSASTLYGGGAIAGLVNLISKTPHEERELRFHLDGTSAGGLNLSGFYGQQFGKFGLTVFGSQNSNAAYDPADIGLTAIPKFNRQTLNTRFFLSATPRTSIIAGINLSKENRIGGDIDFIKEKKPNGFYEENHTVRKGFNLTIDHKLSSSGNLNFKSSLNLFDRKINLDNYEFDGDQELSFVEMSYSYHGEEHEWVVGANFTNDNFSEHKITSTPLRNYRQTTFGGFVQNNWHVTERFSLESGVRIDNVADYDAVFLPRISGLFKFSPQITSRVGGGMGYKAPNIFTEDAERLYFAMILPVDVNENKLEKSYGLNADVNYKTSFADGDISFSINHLFFYTRINSPLLLKPDGSFYRFYNANGHFDSKGMETNIKIGYSDFKLFLGYTFTKAYLHEGENKKENYLTPRHRINSVLLYEVEEKWKIGLEGYYFDKQLLSDGTTGKSYWITGFMVEKLWPKFSIYINFENFLDSRQTKFDTIFTGPISNPVFRDIYAPVDGFVVNGGIKLRF